MQVCSVRWSPVSTFSKEGMLWCMRWVRPLRLIVKEDCDRVVVMGVRVWRSMVIFPLTCV